LSTVTVVGGTGWAIIAMIVSGSGAIASGLAGNYQNLAIFSMALVGGCIGFLRFNRYPAMVFMGDTGSMFIGGALVGMAMLMRMPIHMIFMSITLLASSFSVIIQRAYFKATHGKRIFKMSPIHHHFELSGMTEKQIVLMYGIVEAIACVITILSI